MWSQATSGQVLHNPPSPENAASLLPLFWWRSSNVRVLSVAEGNIGTTRFRQLLAALRTDASLSSSKTERWSNNSSERCSAIWGRAIKPAQRTATSSSINASIRVEWPSQASRPCSRIRAWMPSQRSIRCSFPRHLTVIVAIWPHASEVICPSGIAIKGPSSTLGPFTLRCGPSVWIGRPVRGSRAIYPAILGRG